MIPQDGGPVNDHKPGATTGSVWTYRCNLPREGQDKCRPTNAR